jgi:hypothetical protein
MPGDARPFFPSCCSDSVEREELVRHVEEFACRYRSCPVHDLRGGAAPGLEQQHVFGPHDRNSFLGGASVAGMVGLGNAVRRALEVQKKPPISERLDFQQTPSS